MQQQMNACSPQDRAKGGRYWRDTAAGVAALLMLPCCMPNCPVAMRIGVLDMIIPNAPNSTALQPQPAVLTARDFRNL